MDLIDIGLIVNYLLLGVATLVAIVLPIINLFSNPKGLIRIVIGVVVLVGLFFIAYAMSDSTVTPKMVGLGVDGSGIKIISAGLIMLYLFLFGSLLAVVASEVTKMFK